MLQILHVRDSDSFCTLQVWLDGVEVTATFDLVDVDPGAGYARADWQARIDEARADSSPFGQAVLAALESHAD